MFQWINWLSTEALDYLQLTFPLDLASNEPSDDSRVVKNPHAYLARLRFVLDHDRAQNEKTFLNSFYDCGICFDQKVGGECLKFFACGHVYCRDCLGSFFISQIESRAVRFMLCPDPKCKKQAIPNEVPFFVGFVVVSLKNPPFSLSNRFLGPASRPYKPL